MFAIDLSVYKQIDNHELARTKSVQYAEHLVREKAKEYVFAGWSAFECQGYMLLFDPNSEEVKLLAITGLGEEA